MPASGGGPGWQLRLRVLRGRRGRSGPGRSCTRSAATSSRTRSRSSAASTGRSWRSSSSRSGASRPPRATSRRAEQRRRRARTSTCPTALALRGRAAVLLGAGEPRGGGRRRRRPRPRADGGRRPARRRRSPACLAGRALVAAGERDRGDRRRCAPPRRELDVCGSVRVRDEMRRELRKLGARAEKRGPAAAGDSGVAALTKREREIADLVTDRKTNREIAADAVPERQDDRVAPAQHLRQARRAPRASTSRAPSSAAREADADAA